MLTRIKSFLIRSIKNKKLNVFGIFLLLSFLFLVVSKLSKKYTQPLSFNIEYVNVPENIIIKSKEKTKLDITLSAFGFNLLPYYLYDNTLNIDFESDVSLVKNEYVWIANKEQYKLESNFGSSVTIQSIEPDTLKFLFETLMVKKIPVKLDSRITFASGYDIDKDLNVIPDSISIIGSKNEISRINEIFTVPFNLNDVNIDINSSLAIHLPDSISELKLSIDKVKIIGKVEKFTEGTVEIPVSIKNLPNDVTINYFPKSVTVSYYVSLNNYNSVKDSDFQVDCDFNNISSSKQSFFTPKLSKIPEIVKSARIKQSKIEFILVE